METSARLAKKIESIPKEFSSGSFSVTTIQTPRNPKKSPIHFLLVSISLSRGQARIPVSRGCKPTIKAAMAADKTPLTPRIYHLSSLHGPTHQQFRHVINLRDFRAKALYTTIPKALENKLRSEIVYSEKSLVPHGACPSLHQ